VKKHDLFFVHDPPRGYWVHGNTQRIVVPPDKDALQLVAETWHDSPSSGHPGRDETYWKISNTLYWPGMKDWIANYVKGYATCQQNKNLTHKTRAPQYKITVPTDATPFSQIALNLITGLPKSNGYDAILTIIDHGCSRAAIFLPCTSQITGPGIAQLYFNNVYRWFGLHTKVISDHDPRFTSHFGRVLSKELGITRNLSTVFHPQTDRLTERTNQWVEQYLRLLMTNQRDWSKWLTMATIVHNNTRNSTTGFAPSTLLVGWEPTLAPPQKQPSSNLAASRSVEQLR
jgi:hypothetical protein